MNYVDDNAFRDSVYLKSVTFGAAENLQVHSNAFYNTGLTSLYLPANLSYVGEYAFIGLKDLTAYTVAGENPRYKSINGVLYSKDGKKLIAYPAGKTGNFTVPKEVETIGFGAFENSLIEAVSFEDGINLLTIGYRAFYKSEKLASVSIPESVVSIDFYAFAECRNLERVTFAENNKLTGIYEGAFLNCSSLTDIIIPDNIVEVSDFAFYGCRALTKLPFSETSEVKGIYDYAFAYSGITELVIPDSVVEIGAYAFRGARLTTVKISDAQMYQLIIGIGAFQGCEELSEITLPFIGASFEDEDITWFGYIFGAGAYTANNTYVPASLKTVTITEGISFVGTGAFYHLLNIEKINVPHSVSKVYSGSFATIAEYEFTNEISIESDYLGTEYFALNGRLIFDSTTTDNTYISGISGDLTLAEGITVIDYWAFNMSKLTSVYIPSSVQLIRGYAFQSCEKLKKVVFDENCKTTEISESLFNGDVSLSEIELPETIEKIGPAAFQNCKNLKSIVIPSRVNTIEQSAFAWCENLTCVSFGENSQLQSLGEYAFAWCSGLVDIKIPEGITTVENATFMNCSFTLFEIPGSVQEIKSQAFYESRLNVVTIPDNVKSIAGAAFAGSALNTIVIGKSVGSIENDSFYECRRLYKIINNSNLELTIGSKDNGYLAYYAEEITDKNGNKTYKDEESGFAFVDTVDGFRFTIKNGEYTLIDYFGNEDTTRLPDDVNGKEYSIYQLIGIKNVIVPGTIKNVGDNAFPVVLNSLILEEGVQSIDSSAIRCASYISLPASLQSIGTGNFIGDIQTIELNSESNYFTLKEGVLYTKDYSRLIRCPASVTSFVIPKETSYIESYAFSECDSLLDVYYEGTIDEWFNVEMGWAGCNPSEYAEHFYINGKELAETIVVPGNKASISNSKFENNKKITEVVISEGVESIGFYAFKNCSNLRKITLPASLQYVGQSAFFGCDNLTEVVFNGTLEDWFNIEFVLGHYLLDNVESLYVDGENVANEPLIIPDTVTSIKENTFAYFKGLTSVTIASNVVSIGRDAFFGCSNLSKITFAENGKLEIIGDRAFAGSSIVSIDIPSIVTNVGSRAFEGCQKLVSVSLPESVKNIGRDLFGSCEKLEHVKLPRSIEFVPIGMFSSCSSLKSIELPETVTTIQDGAFYQCSGLVSVVLPNGLTKIENNAFYECNNLYTVINKSSLQLVMGSQDNGQVAYNAKIIVDNEGNKTYKEEDTGATYFETADGFLFKTENEQYTLIAYLGNEDTVTLPTDVNGKEYTIYQMSGIKNIVIPKTMRKIDDHAFENCDTLLSVTFEEGCCVESIGYMAFYSCKKLTDFIIPKTVVSIKSEAVSYCDSLISLASESGSLLTSMDGGAFQRCGSLKSVNFENSKQLAYLGSYVFYECQQLSNIILPNNIMNINQGAFSDTAYYNDLNNWNDGCLYIGDYLIKVNSEVKFVQVRNNTICIVDDAFSDCNKLLRLTISKNHFNLLSGLTNLETLILTELPEYLLSYFGETSFIPITFKRVVFKVNCYFYNQNFFSGISGITIYVEDEKQACQWDNLYPGWNNGNRVYYGGEWINAEFKNADGEIISSDYYTVNQVIRQPFVDSIENGTKKLVFVGWDLDGDGIADNMPATSTKNISATAVMAEADNVVTVRYYDFDGSLYVKQNYVYSDTIVLPAALSKKGYMFDGWQGYIENMVATSDLEFVSLWAHEGGGHTFDTVTIEPTCTEKGYDRHTCSVCDYQYTDNFVGELGHNFGGWKVGTEPTCTEEGLEHRECSNCSIREEAPISAKGHNYTVKVITEPTCAHTGKKTYTCADCGTVETEILAKTEHKYKKHYVSKSWLEMLVERILNVFFGYEGENAFFYRCEVCGEIMTSSGMSAMSVSAQDTCVHELGDWEVSVEPTHVEGVAIRKCSICGKAVEAKTLEADGTHTESNWIIDIEPTCTANGARHKECTFCGEVLEYEVLSELGHDYEEEWTVDKEATCTAKGSKSHHCSRCSAVTEVTEIAANGHNYGETLTVEATCETAGYTYHVCATCGYLEKVEDIEAKGHAESGWITDVAATCGQDGYKHKECLTCGKILAKEYLDREGHSYGETLTVAATCEKGGYTYHVCEVCGRYEKVDDLSATGHTASDWIVDREATCAAEGLEHKECTVCGKVLDTKTTEADAHTYGEKLTVEATCEKAGYTYHICKVCGHYEKIVDLPAQGHSHIIDRGKDATCTETGLTKGEHCGTCGKVFVKQEVIAKIAHTESEWIVDNAATCAGGGFRHKECLTCGEILKIEQINPNGHKYGDTLTVEATCEEAGYTYHVCETCGYSERTSTLNATGHMEVIDSAKAATCSETGLTEGKHCSVCGKILKAQEVIAKKAHTESDWIVDSKAGCETAGSKHKECVVCKEILKIESISAEGHTAGNYIVDYDATCESAGSKHKECKKCGKVLEKAQIAAKGHEYGEWTVDLEPTVNAEGREYRKCVRCEHREERSVEKLKGGCGGSIYADGGLFAIILALAVSVVTTMKKRGKQR